MIKALGWMVVIAAVGGGAWLTRGWWMPEAPEADPVAEVKSAPKIEQVRKLARLVTLHVPISDAQVHELEGWSGTVKLTLDVFGEVEIATDLSRARFEEVDRETQRLVLVLPKPTTSRPRLDHERTRVRDVRRTGLWRITGAEEAERVLTNRAMAAAQRTIHAAAQREDLIVQACQHTEQVMREFFAAMAWQVALQWDEGEGAAE